MSWLGIDPGLAGALCWRAGPACEFHDMPVLAAGKGKRRVYDVDGCDHLVQAYLARGLKWIVLEHVQPMPRNGALTAYSQGQAHMLWLVLCHTHSVSLRLVSPQVWKRALGLSGKGKDGSLMLARQLFPGAAADLRRAKDDGRAEALLLTVWAERHG